MKITVVGTGYVGMSMALLLSQKNDVIALDIDGTLVHDNGFLSPRVVEQVARVRALGHEVIVATGRSAANAIPVIKDVGIHHGYAVCSNGAVTIKVEPEHERGFTPHEVITFNPAEVLSKLIVKLPTEENHAGGPKGIFDCAVRSSDSTIAFSSACLDEDYAKVNSTGSITLASLR